MKITTVLLMVAIGGWCLPAKLEELQTSETKQVPVLIKDLPDMHVQVSESDDGTLGVEVYQGTGTARTRVPTRSWKVPATWKVPAQDSSKVVHAELLTTGQVVLVIYSPKTGFDVVLLPLEIIEVETGNIPEVTSNHPIIFPNFTVPWHPTVSSIPKQWEWVSSDETVTYNPKPYVIPEKTSLLNPKPYSGPIVPSY